MYKFLGLQPPTNKQRTSSEREEKQNNYDRIVHECAFSENRPWLKYIQEENKMHCVTCDEAAEVDKSINNNLNNLMTIKMLAALIKEFDPIPTIEHWNVAGIRQLQKENNSEEENTSSVTGHQMTIKMIMLKMS